MKRKGLFAKTVCCVLMAITCALPLFAAGCGEGESETEIPPVIEKPTEKREIILSQTKIQLILGDEALGRSLLSAELLLNGEPQEDAEFDFTVKTKEIVQIENGVITALEAGQTQIEVSCGDMSETAEVVVYGSATEEQINSFSEEYVNRFGRTYLSRKALVLDNVATGLEFCFYGTTAGVEITASADCYFTAFIDGAEQGNFVKAKKGTGTYELFRADQKGFHTVRILKSSEINIGTLTVKQIKGAERYLVAPAKSELLIEFIGDSITTGYGARANGGSWSIDNTDVCSSFSYRTAQALGADFSIIAREGICVNVDVWGIGVCMSQLYRYTALTTQASYGFADKPDVVVLGLGTNDASYITSHPEYAEQFPEDYKAFLVYIREKRPDAHIICVYGMMGIHTDVERGIRQAIEELNDDKISYFTRFTPDHGGAVGHPSSTAHKGYAEELSKYVRELLQR